MKMKFEHWLAVFAIMMVMVMCAVLATWGW